MASQELLKLHASKPVKFTDTLDQYSYNDNLICKMQFDSYIPGKSDRIGIFKLGWQSIKDCIVYKWVPSFAESFSKEICVVFEKCILPKKENELYQFCYLSGGNELYEASLPFTFGKDKTERITEGSLKPFSEDNLKRSNLASSVSAYSESEEIIKLREENELLKACLKALVFDKENTKNPNYEAQLVEIKELVNSLKATFVLHYQEVAVLKQKFSEIEKENRKLHLEKMTLEKKVEKSTEKSAVKLDNSAEDLTIDSIKLENKITSNVEFDIENLKSIPPFPFS